METSGDVYKLEDYLKSGALCEKASGGSIHDIRKIAECDWKAIDRD